MNRNQKNKPKKETDALLAENSVASLKKLSNKRQAAYTWLNFIILMIVFITIIIMIFSFSNISYYNNLNNKMEKVAESLVNLPMQEPNSDMLPLSIYVFYYSPEGKLLTGYGNGGNVKKYIDSLGIVDSFYSVVVAENVKLKVLTKQINKESSSGYVKICKIVDDSEEIFNKLLWGIGLFTPIATIILFIISILLAHNQVKPYQKALDSSLTFTSNVSHELNTPLSIVKANLENILNEDVTGIYAQQIVASITEVDRLKRLTGQLLFLSRSDNKRLTYIHKLENPKTLLNNIIEPYAYLAEGQGKHLNIYFGAGLDTNYMMDKDLFHQILVALLDNAIKYTVAGEKINVNARVQRGKLYLTVSDNGCGVADDELDKIFVRFYRSERSRTTAGTGLGLPIVHAIVASLGGKVTASNITPKGFSVSVVVPLSHIEENKLKQK